MNQKQKLWKAILIPTVSLFLICVVSTVLLAVTNSVTAPMIEDLAAKRPLKPARQCSARPNALAIRKP